MSEKFPTQNAEELANIYADEQIHLEQAEAAAQEQRLEEWFDRSQQNGKDNLEYLAARPTEETDAESRNNILNGRQLAPQVGEEATAPDLSQFDKFNSAQIAQKLANADFKQDQERASLLSEALATKVRTELADEKQAAIAELLEDPNHRRADLKALEQIDDDESIRERTEELFTYSKEFRDTIARKDARDKAKSEHVPETTDEESAQESDTETPDAVSEQEPAQAKDAESELQDAADEIAAIRGKEKPETTKSETDPKSDEKIVTEPVKPAAPKKKTALDKRVAVSIASQQLNVEDQARRVRLGQLAPLPEQAKPKEKEAPFEPLTKIEFNRLSRDEQHEYKAREAVEIEKYLRAKAHNDYREAKYNINQEIDRLDTFLKKGAKAEIEDRIKKADAAEQAKQRIVPVEQVEAKAEEVEVKKRLKRTRRAAKWLIRGWVDDDKNQAEAQANDQKAANEVLNSLYRGEDTPETEPEDPKVVAEKKAREERKAAQAAKLGGVATRSTDSGKFEATPKESTVKS